MPIIINHQPSAGVSCPALKYGIIFQGKGQALHSFHLYPNNPVSHYYQIKGDKASGLYVFLTPTIKYGDRGHVGAHCSFSVKHGKLKIHGVGFCKAPTLKPTITKGALHSYTITLPKYACIQIN